MDKHIKSSIRVRGRIYEIFKIWENFENFPNFMHNVKSIKKTGDRTSHWIMIGPMGKDYEWDAEITKIIKNEIISWHSIDGDLKTTGEVTFHEISSDETEVTVDIGYNPPGGFVGEGLAKLFGDPKSMLDEDLRNFKNYSEKKANAGTPTI